jgi:hypothetical protein
MSAPIVSCPPIGALVTRPWVPTPLAVIAPVIETLPPTPPARLMPIVLLPVTLIVPALLRSPVIEPLCAIKMPVELSPWMVIAPVLSLVMAPSSTPFSTSMPIRSVPVAKGPPAMPVLPLTVGV